MFSLRMAGLWLFEEGLHVLDHARKDRLSPQLEAVKRAELDAYFYLRRLGATVVARNWVSGQASGDIDLIAWEGGTLCFVEVSLRGPSSMQGQRQAGVNEQKRRLVMKLAKLYIGHLPGSEETRFDILFVDLKSGQEQGPPGSLKKKRPAPQFEYVRGAF